MAKNRPLGTWCASWVRSPGRAIRPPRGDLICVADAPNDPCAKFEANRPTHKKVFAMSTQGSGSLVSRVSRALFGVIGGALPGPSVSEEEPSDLSSSEESETHGLGSTASESECSLADAASDGEVLLAAESLESSTAGADGVGHSPLPSNIGKMTLRTMRDAASARGLSDEGTSADLRKRLVEYQQLHEVPKGEAPQGKKRSSRSKGGKVKKRPR